MITLRKTASGLVLEPDDLDSLQEAADLPEALESNLCNGWEVIAPEECGALTNGIIITDDYDRNDHGNLTHLGTVYWDANYAVRSALDELKAGRTVTFVAAH